MNDWKNYKKYLVSAYSKKVLIRRAYNAEKTEFTADDLVDIDLLLQLLAEAFSAEAYITRAGKAFIKFYLGYDGFAELLFRNGFEKELSKEDQQKSDSEKIAAIARLLANYSYGVPEKDPKSDRDEPLPQHIV